MASPINRRPRPRRARVDKIVDLLASFEPEDIVRITGTKHPQEHGEQEGIPRSLGSKPC